MEEQREELDPGTLYEIIQHKSSLMKMKSPNNMLQQKFVYVFAIKFNVLPNNYKNHRPMVIKGDSYSI